jgi:type IV pilus assembly protein PilC
MPTYTYTARTFGGDLKSATIDAPSRDEVVAQLKRQRLTVVKVDEEAKKQKLTGKIGMRDIVIFTRQFSTMINAGLPLVQALDILAKQSENKALAEVTRAVVFDVESGATVSDAMRNHPRAFSDLFTNMVAAGEAGGILDTILMRLATFLEKNDALVRKVKGAMIYPGVIMSVAGVAITVLLWKVIPVFEDMFKSVNLELPLPTRVVVGMSRFVNGYWWAAAVSRFTRTLGTLISSGVSILDGLEITARTAGNRVIQDAIMQSRSSIAGGDTIAAPLQKSGVFPPMVISMIAVGEQTGGLDEMLSKIADFYDTEVDAAVSGLLALLEPIMIVVLGVVVGGMVVAMYLPIFDMINAVQ